MDIDIWNKQPRNGLTSFFTEGNFNRILGIESETLHDRILRRLETVRRNTAHGAQFSSKSNVAPPPKTPAQKSGVKTAKVQVKTENPSDTDQVTKVTAEGKPEQPREMGPSKELVVQHTKVEAKKSESKIFVPVVLPSYRFRYTRKSRLKHAEQQRYLVLFEKYLDCVPQEPTQQEIDELAEMKVLQTRVKAEQNEFQDLLRIVCKQSPESYNYIHHDVKQYVEEYLASKRKRVKLYPRHYSSHDTLSLSTTQVGEPNVGFFHMKTLLELGDVPKIILPVANTGNYRKLTTDYTQVTQQFPATPTVVGGAGIWNHEPCSQDTNAETLGRKYRCHVVMSAAALKCLVDNQGPKFTQQWQLPVTVREYEEQDGGQLCVHRVVYIDNPLVPKALTMREKNALFYKFALKTLLIQQKLKGHTFVTSGLSKDKKEHTASKIQSCTVSENLNSGGNFTSVEREHLEDENIKRKRADSLRNEKLDDHSEIDGLDNDDLESFGANGTSREIENMKEDHDELFETENIDMDELETFGTVKYSGLLSEKKLSGMEHPKEDDCTRTLETGDSEMKEDEILFTGGQK